MLDTLVRYKSERRRRIHRPVEPPLEQPMMSEERPIVNSPPQTRSGRQRGEKGTPFSEEEIALFKTALKDHGENWLEICKTFAEKKFERDEEQIKLFYKTNGRKYKFKEILKERESRKPEIKKEPDTVEAVKVVIKARVRIQA